MQGKLPHDFLLKNPNTGRGYKVKTLSKYWPEFSGIDVTYYESSRHSFCTQIAEDADVNEFKAEALMRHKDPRSTRKYIHADVTR
ncbi:MAG TPA: hypothetical protein DCP92_10795 [Nitrospiraceae bacterium]|jgi:integrase|nr:hypothetical protein [Nitrospiraceae bacterium]